jgi:hypothetical protein
VPFGFGAEGVAVEEPHYILCRIDDKPTVWQLHERREQNLLTVQLATRPIRGARQVRLAPCNRASVAWLRPQLHRQRATLSWTLFLLIDY